MIFLGAGASKPYGIPTLQEFSKDVSEKLMETGHEVLINDIHQSLDEFGMVVDFESLYSILEGLSNPVRSIHYAGPLTAFLLKSKHNLARRKDFSQILTDLRKLIYEKCSIISNERNFRKVEECMDKLLEVTEKNTCIERIVGKTGPRVVNIGKILATTNYDMALELYFLSKGVPITDGYKHTGASTVSHFDPGLLSDPYAPEIARGIIKLHGSIWQFVTGKDMIKTNQNPKSWGFPFKIKVEREMMIYPTREKDILNYRFFPFFSIFKSISWTKLLVIGYSFRDELINTAIIENMQLYDKSQLIILNPQPDKHWKTCTTIPQKMLHGNT
jgi:hypothetical protein